MLKWLVSTAEMNVKGLDRDLINGPLAPRSSIGSSLPHVRSFPTRFDEILYVPESEKLESIMQTKAARQNRVASLQRRPFEEQLNRPQTFSLLDLLCLGVFAFTLFSFCENVGLQGFGLVEVSAFKLLPDLGVNSPRTQPFLYNAI